MQTERRMIAGFHSESTIVNGISIHYWIGGNPNGPPVLLWHGFLGTAYTWHTLMPLLVEASYSVLVRGKKSTVHAGETINIPANAPHQFHNASLKSARLICICSPAGQEKFFLEVGVPVATRTTPPPKLDEKQMAEFLHKAKTLAPKYKTELLEKA